MRRGIIILILVAGVTAATQARQAGTDVTQWRGANRDGVVTGFTAPAIMAGATDAAMEGGRRPRLRHAPRRRQQGLRLLAPGR